MIDPHPDVKCLRKFGLSIGAFLGAVFGLFLPFVFEYSFPIWPWIIAGVLGAIAWKMPVLLGVLFQIWVKLFFVISQINSTIIMGIIFYCVVTPLGILMRLTSRNHFKRKFDKSLESYRLPSVPTTREDFNHPF